MKRDEGGGVGNTAGKVSPFMVAEGERWSKECSKTGYRFKVASL